MLTEGTQTKQQYFGKIGWTFQTPEGKALQKYSSVKIKRHTKVKGNKSPFDGDFVYWATRMGKSPMLSSLKAKLLRKQEGQCNLCKLYFRQGDTMEMDHIIPRQYGGTNKYTNLQLLHNHCHDSKSADDHLCFERC